MINYKFFKYNNIYIPILHYNYFSIRWISEARPSLDLKGGGGLAITRGRKGFHRRLVNSKISGFGNR